MRLRCPKCGIIENIDSTYINCECECECGHNFIISNQYIIKTIKLPKRKTLILPKQKTITQPKQKMTTNTTKSNSIQEYTPFNRLTYFLHIFGSALVAIFSVALFGVWTPMHILSYILISVWQAVITHKRVVDYGGNSVTPVIGIGLASFLSIISNLVNPSFVMFLIIVSIYNFVIFIMCLICPSKHKTY